MGLRDIFARKIKIVVRVDWDTFQVVKKRAHAWHEVPAVYASKLIEEQLLTQQHWFSYSYMKQPHKLTIKIKKHLLPIIREKADQRLTTNEEIVHSILQNALAARGGQL